MNISIIGAGPAGNYLAYLLAKNKAMVSVYEEHKLIGCPIQCTGILTNSIKNILKLPKSVIATQIPKLKIISPDNKEVLFKFKDQNIIVHRNKFDNYIAKLAKSAGAKYYLNSRYINNTKEKLQIRHNKKIQTNYFDFLIGADGPNSMVAKNNKFFQNREFVMGQQILTKLPFEEDTILVYLGVGEFAWIVPEGNNLFRVGLVAKNNSKDIFDKFLERIEKKTKTKIIEIQNQSGLIPVYNPRQKTMNKNIFVLGDAATEVKATSYGGIIHGLLAAECIANYLIKNKSKRKYDKELKKKVTKELYLSLILRKVLNRLTEKDYNDLIGFLQKDKAKRVLEEFDRDFPSKFLMKMIIAQPKLIKFATKILF